MMVFYIVLAIVILLILWIIAMYNGLVGIRTRTDEAWSDIDVQLKRRYDLIPNLVETVKGYASHEQGTLTKVIEARNAAMSAHNSNLSPEEQAKTENILSSTLKSIFALAENYPDLKANENFSQLQQELGDTENKIEASRRFYNGNVRELNTRIDTFPTNIFAGMFGFSKRQFFEAAGAERENVKVSFSS